MEPITTVILSGFMYDMLKYSVSLTGSNIRAKLQGWLIDEALSEKLAHELSQLEINNGMSEAAINNQLTSSAELLNLLSEIKPSNNTTTQTHSGTGDNIAGDKIINN